MYSPASHPNQRPVGWLSTVGEPVSYYTRVRSRVAMLLYYQSIIVRLAREVLVCFVSFCLFERFSIVIWIIPLPTVFIRKWIRWWKDLWENKWGIEMIQFSEIRILRDLGFVIVGLFIIVLCEQSGYHPQTWKENLWWIVMTITMNRTGKTFRLPKDRSGAEYRPRTEFAVRNRREPPGIRENLDNSPEFEKTLWNDQWWHYISILLDMLAHLSFEVSLPWNKVKKSKVQTSMTVFIYLSHGPVFFRIPVCWVSFFNFILTIAPCPFFVYVIIWSRDWSVFKFLEVDWMLLLFVILWDNI